MNPVIHLQLPEDQHAFTDLLKQAAQATLEIEGTSDCEVTLALIGLEEMRALNLRFASLDEPTDVLSFPDNSRSPETGLQYLGDIALCVPVARAQAEKAGHALRDELMLLTVHGMLHLLGYDHANEEDRVVMWTRQSEVLILLDVDLGAGAGSP